ncbi:MAG: FAD-binding protein [gamma proteobacterium symbiont of Bathyaustriella thionipta]|nr:FAD-binding protein [gamma proteobacterium symbiont of Bathyaustriella thionipta]MCU7948895.1 FAD-binding protein [gamma proteobacterium symbiont of Bathyaustriella thionipta]MCU7953215.1 FAD-binding protein [gamma proteobacterium symbiont of Bathyaustriella thionipta]MCU7955469.1 FAD-binding protein [gamma proteobacterium symbiont of Bathyaustriella thionipta]MCU7966445.1 FAD-binding protein [gamma proteobacterium symbiont of Bathyaustriella thionipta]
MSQNRDLNGTISYQQALGNYHLQKQSLEGFPAAELSMDEQQLLKDFHPDHRQETMTTLQVGPNKGDRCHKQIADVLQADSRIDAADLAGARIQETDVLVIGGGGAGCAAALMAAESGARVILTTKLKLGDSNTVMAEGGIQASIEKGDTPQSHFNDTFKAGHKSADKELIKKLVMDGPETIRWLIQQGMQFDLNEFGDLLTRKAGGTSANRVVYFRDYTGLEMMRVLRESVKNSDVDVWDYSPAVELLSNESGHCAGAIISSLQDCRYVQIKAKTVIVATGGIGRVHLNQFPTSNHFGATGDGLVLAYRLGARLRDLDSFQYHPTGVAYPQHLSGTLITEGLRSSGAYIINALGERFVNELKPRDIVAAAIIRECEEGRGVVGDSASGSSDMRGVWLDTPGLEARNPGILKKRFPKLIQLGLKSKIDITQTPMLIYPTLHYQNGGVVIDENGRSGIEGLYCVGEVSGGIHGRNRLMGNALLEIISFGRKAGVSAVKDRKTRGHKQITIDHISNLRRELMQKNMPMSGKSPLLFPQYAQYDAEKNTTASNESSGFCGVCDQ